MAACTALFFLPSIGPTLEQRRFAMFRTRLNLAVLSGLLALAGAPAAQAASHREAPLVAQDPAADITDVYAFVSYDAENLARAPKDRKVTLIMNVNPGQNPADGPNYFNFADDVVYRLGVDNNRDGIANDLVYEFRFQTADRPIGGAGGLTSPVPMLGNPAIPGAFPLQGITALNGPGSEGLTRRQTYTVTEIRGGRSTVLFSGLVAVPSNSGNSTFPDYESLAAQGIYSDAAGDIRVFAGQRAETFYIDLGGAFDTLNFRRSPPVQNGPDEDADNVNPFGLNRFANTNVSTIALELPISQLTADGKAASNANKLIGVYASTLRPKVRVLRDTGGFANSGPLVQVARMANPLVNELIINTPSKDLWNAQSPQAEGQFASFYKSPVIAAALELTFGGFGVHVPASPRTDLMSILLKYAGQPLAGQDCGTPCSDLLRLDLSVPPTAADKQKRLGAALAGDGAGFPNGRRPNDDVTDIVVRVTGGADYIGAKVGDGVNFLDGAPGAGTDDGPGYGRLPGNRLDVTTTGIAGEFPFLPTPYPGRQGLGNN
jgi:hypothetical protein